MKELLNLSLLFLIIMDPLGNVPIFVSFLKKFEPDKQRKIILREMLIALAVMVIFLFFGHGFFRLLHIDQPSLQMAGGIILFLIAIRMVFATPREESAKKITQDPLIVPLAVPAVAGPGILATITLYGGSVSSKWIVLASILIAWLMMLPTLLLSPALKRILGENGLVAAERLFGYLVVLVATNMVLSGLLKTIHHAY